MKNYRNRFCMLFAPAFAAVALSGIAATAFAADLFVSVSTGSDSNAGTFAAPFKTIYKAKKAVQTLPRTGPINVWIRSGTYYLDSTLVFGPADGGTASAPITYSAYCGDTAVVSGGERVTTTWTTSSGSIMVTTIAKNLKVDQLFLNGTRQVLARYPNYKPSQVILNGYTSYSSITSRASKWKTPTQGPGYIRAIQSALWGGEDYIITGVSGTTINFTWVGDNNRGSAMNQNEVMVENIFEELDTAGEWYYNNTTGQLFFWPPAGTNLNTATIELASLEELIKVAGTDTTNTVNYIAFNRLTFTQTHRTLFTGTFEGLLRGDWAIVREGTVFIQDAKNITIQNCFFDQIGGNGIFMSAYNRNHYIYNNEFTDVGATCVQVVGVQSAVRSPSTWSNQINPIADMTPGPLTSNYPQNIVIDNNLMKNLGVFEKQTAGVNISMSSKVTVRHNRITISPRSGININDGTWGGHNIEYNDVDSCVRETGDHGPFNSWGRDRYWGTSQTTVQTAALDAIDITQIHNNRFKSINLDGYPAIDLDDGASYYWVYNNLCLQNGIKYREGFRRRGYNNIIVIGRQACHAWYSSCYDSIHHDIIVPSPLFTTGGNANAYDVQAMTLSSANQCYIDYNLFWNNGGGVDYSPTKNAGLDAHSQTADPKFTNAASGDYSVQPGLPALTLGFVNFPMDSFGRMSAPGGAQCPSTETKPVPAGEAVTNFLCRANGSTVTVQYWLGEDGPVTMDLCTLNGKNISTIAKSFEKAGAHTFVWNSKAIKSGACSPNSYLLVLTTTGGKEVRKITLLR